MDELTSAIELAMQKFKEQYGEDAVLEDGESFVTVFNNCSLLISAHKGRLKTEFFGGKPCQVDMTLSVYKEV